MKALFIIGLFLMFVGIVTAAARPATKLGGSLQDGTQDDKTTDRFITISVFAGFVLVIISWIYSLKGQQID